MTPSAATVPLAFRDEGFTVTTHGNTRHVPYHWMSHRKHPKLKPLIDAENRYARSIIPKRLAVTLAEEDDARDAEGAITVAPFVHNGYWHYTRETDDGDDIYCRKPVHCDPDWGDAVLALIREHGADARLPEPDEDEEVVLHEGREERFHRTDSFALESFEYNPSQSWLAYTANVTGGDDDYVLVVRDIATGTVLRKVAKLDGLGTVGPSVAWASDRVLYVSVLDERKAALRVARVDIGAVYPDEVPCTPVSESDRASKSPTGEAPPYGVDAKKVDKTAVTSGTAGVTLTYKETQPGVEVHTLVRCHDETHMAFEVGANTLNEWRLAYLGDDGSAADAGELDWAVFWERQPHVLYELAPHPVGWWIATRYTDTKPQGEVFACDVHASDWPLSFPGDTGAVRPFLRYEPAIPVTDITVYERFVTVAVRTNGMPKLLMVTADAVVAKLRDAAADFPMFTVADLADAQDVIAAIGPAFRPRADDVYGVELLGDSDGFGAPNFRVEVTSPTGPSCEFEISLRDDAPTDAAGVQRWAAAFLMEQPIAVRHTRSDYCAKIVWTTVEESVGPEDVIARAIAATPSATEVRVPSIVLYRKDTFERGKNPIVISTYGSYGDEDALPFRTEHLSLLDRGVVIAEALVRGGGQLGRAWHHAGRFDARRNSITDFIACTRSLCAQGYGDAKRVAAMGGSAGGTVMGGIINLAPELYRAVVLQVPFVDCLTTMLDASRPLTQGEWDEWGNPVADAAAYHAILGYSPLDNLPTPEQVAARGTVFPHVLVDSAWNDGRVSIQEPASYAAALRRLWGPSAAAGRVLVHRCAMEGGHGGSTDEDVAASSEAAIAAFMLSCLGINEQSPVHGTTGSLLNTDDDDLSSSSSEERSRFRRARCLRGRGGGRGAGAGRR